ncbi:hypothetical protein CDAR_476891 [Caerostris darwini]|uniref:Uncharacterized protein n=1 Tax=Caerostris darwini TaxID=1538125 RepID=A0AAV4U5C8_9ARAC|nr:hypothetical protein CDAR_476891 [Caerostris darwini]
MRGNGRFCFSPHTIDRIVIKTRHGALTELIKNSPPSMSVVRIRVGIMEIDLRNDVPPIFHICISAWMGSILYIVNASETCLTSIMAKRLLCLMSFLLKGLPPFLLGGHRWKRDTLLPFIQMRGIIT